MRLPRERPPSPWPYWLLLLAWVCANSPQTATYVAITWLGDVRSFSHQERLAADVARLLTGDELPAAEIAHTERNSPPKSTMPPMPGLTKIELATEKSLHALEPKIPMSRLDVDVVRVESALRAPPPHGPPRVATVS
jgi:hypothetical protein